MKIASFNIRGLGGRVKKTAMRDLVVKEKLDFVCIQETKLEYVDQRLARILWGSTECNWVFSGSVGASGGLCCIWDSTVFERQELWAENGLLGVTGLWKGRKVHIVNVYAPNSLAGKKEVWSQIVEKMRGKEDENWCICGDFNAIRSEEERRGVGRSGREAEMRVFNDFINQSRLVDLPLERRKFTWYKR